MAEKEQAGKRGRTVTSDGNPTKRGGRDSGTDGGQTKRGVRSDEPSGSAETVDGLSATGKLDVTIGGKGSVTDSRDR